MDESTVWVPFDVMEAFAADVFKALGVPADDAAICADVLITADKRGIDSHGIGRLKPIYYDRIRMGGVQAPVTRFEVVREFGATAVIDGHHGMGMVISHRAMRMAIDKARQSGIGMVAVRNSTHYGIAAYYPLMACEAGMIGVTGTNARPSIAPTFGIENMLGTNPLVFAMPTDEPFSFTNDYATSISQRGRIEQYSREGRPLPAGWVVNRQGGTETDAKKVLGMLVRDEAALAPLGGIGEESGGYKGYGFATVVELLSSALQQGSFLKQLSGFDAAGKPVPYGLGHFFIAIHIEAFTDLAAFKRSAGDLLRSLRASARAPGCDRIYTCGEKEHLAWLARKDKGVPLNAALQKDVLAMQAELGLKQYAFTFAGS